MPESRQDQPPAQPRLRLSLRTTLLASFVVLIWGAVSSLTLLVSYSTERFLIPHAENLMEIAGTSVLNQAQSILETASDAAELTRSLVRSEIVASSRKDLMERFFFEQMRQHRRFNAIFYGTPDGSWVYVTRRAEDLPTQLRTEIIDFDHGVKRSVVALRAEDFTILEKKTIDDPYDPRERPWYVKAMAERGLVWVPPYMFFHAKRPGITAASQVQDAGGNLLGIVAVNIELTELSENLARMSGSWGGSAFIFDRDGVIVAHSNPALVVGEDVRTLPRVTDIDDERTKAAFASVPWRAEDGKYAAGDKRFGTFRLGGEDYLALFKFFDKPELSWGVGVYLSKDAFLGPLKQGFVVFYAVAVVVTLAATAMAMLIHRRIRRPLAEIEADAMAITRKDLSPKAYPPTPFSEVTALYDAFGAMKAWIAEYEAENEHLQGELKQSHLETIILLAGCAEYRDKETAGHLLRISEYAAILAEGLGMPPREVELVAHAAPLHDVGKLGVPDAILTKPGKLTDEEWIVMKRHTVMGRDILNPARSDFVRIAQDIAYCHHERYDGGGYPRGIAGEDIPLAARIVAVTDAFDAMTSKRCYKDPIHFDQAMGVLVQDAGSHFDPRCVTAFVESVERVRALYDRLHGRDAAASGGDKHFLCL